jgi:hypothetical protein
MLRPQKTEALCGNTFDQEFAALVSLIVPLFELLPKLLYLQSQLGYRL